MMKRAHLIFLILAGLLTACGEKDNNVPEDLGNPCTTDNYERHCVGNAIVYCSTDNTVKSTSCTHTDAQGHEYRCVAFSTPIVNACDPETDEDCELNTTADCFSDAKKCDKENESYTICETSVSGVSYNKTYTCTKTVDGSLYYKQTASNQCHDGYGICSESGECLEPKACDYEDHCENGNLYRCNKNRERINRCTDYATPQTCAVVDGTPACRNPKHECTEEGHEIITSCNENTGKEFVRRCAQADNGKMYYVSAGTRLCQNGCNADKTACAPVPCTDGESKNVCRMTVSAAYIDRYACKDVDGSRVLQFESSDKCEDGTCNEDGTCKVAEACESKNYVSHCDGNIAMNCTLKKEKEKRCDYNEKTCDVLDGKASCFDDEDVCANENEETIVKCNASTSKETIKTCSKAESGKLYWVQSTRKCATGCNADETACAE